MQEKEILQNCLEYVAIKASRSSVSDWTDGNFIELSEAIKEETGILIHRNTLKKLFGKMRAGEESRPQKETRNALAQYVGFKDWLGFTIHFENQQNNNVVVDELKNEVFDPKENGITQIDTSELAMRGDSTNNWIFGIIMLIIMILAVFYWKSKANKIGKDSTISTQVNVNYLKCKAA